MPSPSPSLQDWPVKAACAIGFAGWQGDQLKTLGQVEDYFGKLCMDVDFTLGEPGSVRWFLDWFDHMPRDLMRRQLLAEVNVELATRQPHTKGVPMKECPLRFDTPPEVLADWLDEHGWTADDVAAWYAALVAALHVPEALPAKRPFPGVDDPCLSDEERQEEWEMALEMFNQPNHVVGGE
jgi:hypothetical protein